MTSKTYAECLERDICKSLITSCESEITSVTYHVPPSNHIHCQLHLKNGFVIEGLAAPSGVRAKDMQSARRNAIRQFLNIKRYCEMERLYRESKIT